MTKVWNEHPRRLDRKKSKTNSKTTLTTKSKSKSITQHYNREQYKRLGYCWGNLDLAPKVQVRDKIPHAVMEHGSLDHISKATLALKKELKKLKELKMMLLENDMDAKSLALAVEKLILLATHYYNETKDLPFDWIHQKFLGIDKRGWKINYPDIKKCEDEFLIFPAPKVVHVEEDECETVKGSLKDQKLSRLGKLVTPSHLECRFVMKQGFLFPLNEKEMEIWHLFKVYEKETLEAEVISDEGIRSINVDHDVVRMFGLFAVDLFNLACEKYVKKGEHNNLHDIEIMECKYMKDKEAYYFYMIIEAIEEGKRGTYLAQLLIRSLDGAITLSKFALTDDKPCGVRALGVYYLSCLTCVCRTVHDIFIEKENRLKKISQILTADERSAALSEIWNLEKLYREAMIGAGQRLDEDIETFLAPCWRTNPDDWTFPDPDYTGMVPRANDTACIGYDYYNPFFPTLRVSNMKRNWNEHVSSTGRNEEKKRKKKIALTVGTSLRQLRASLRALFRCL